MEIKIQSLMQTNIKNILLAVMAVNYKLSFIDTFHFLSSSFDSFVKNLNKNDFKYLSKEFDNNVLDLVKQKGFYL